jgi:hypothetical protein
VRTGTNIDKNSAKTRLVAMTESAAGETVLRRLQGLLTYPHEELDTELKNWLDLSSEDHKANLAQAILALANHGGGFILLGFTKTDGAWAPAEPRPSDLKAYSQDSVNSIVYRYAEPPFHCDVYPVPHPETGLLYPIVVVPGEHRAPIRSKREGPNGVHVRNNTYYIRRPGPKSEPPQSGREWDELIGRCVTAARDYLLERIREILQGSSATRPGTLGRLETEKHALESWIDESTTRFKSLVAQELSDEKPSRYSKGTWHVAYSILGNLRPLTLGELLDILRKVKGHETGWPPWWVPTRDEIEPYPYEGVVECWLKETRSTSLFDDSRSDNFRFTANSDFWRASPKGMMFLLRGYQEDSSPRLHPGTVLDVTLPIWRTGECLLHAQRLAVALGGESASVMLRFTWQGLSGRMLTAWADPRRILFDPIGPSRQDSVTSEITVSTDQISATLPEIVKTLTAPLYGMFDFYAPPLAVIQEELSKMRR